MRVRDLDIKMYCILSLLYLIVTNGNAALVFCWNWWLSIFRLHIAAPKESPINLHGFVWSPLSTGHTTKVASFIHCTECSTPIIIMILWLLSLHCLMFLRSSPRYSSAESRHSTHVPHLDQTVQYFIRNFRRTQDLRKGASAVDTSLTVHPSAASVIRQPQNALYTSTNNLSALKADKIDEVRILMLWFLLQLMFHERYLSAQPSSDLRDMCNLILRQLVEATAAHGFREVRAYIRSCTSLGSETAKLVLISSVKPGSSSEHVATASSDEAVGSSGKHCYHENPFRDRIVLQPLLFLARLLLGQKTAG
jgi:hypothetical protein